ncbi:hypothetical protein NW757_010867 [Fusarium falciforme]|nr:hypothetical protein NW757_010867 [Fusarium falciforme]
MPSLRNTLLASLLAASVSGRDVPANVKSFKDSIIKQGSCKSTLATGFYSSDGDSGTYSYCGDHVKDYNVIYLQGKNGKLVNMDIDCDGIQGSPADDGRCGSSGDTQSVTSFQWVLESYGTSQKDLDANIHPYIVFGNEGTKSGWKTFDPEKHGIKPLSVMAVVCGNKMVSLPLRKARYQLTLSSSTAFGVTKTATMATTPWSERRPSRSPRPALASR